MNPSVTDRTVHELDRRGYVRDWLVGPVWSHQCIDLDSVLSATGSPWGPDGRWVLTNGPDVAPLKSRLYERRPLVVDQPLPVVVENGAVSWHSPFDSVDDGTLTRVHTGWDGLVDWSQFCFTPEYRHAVAATALEVDQAEWRTLEVACTGPFSIWVGGELLGEFTDFSYMEPLRHELRVRLPSGLTPIVVSTWQVAFREVRHVVSLRIGGLPVRVAIPSPGADEHVSAVAERLLNALSVERWGVGDGVATLRGPAGLAVTVNVDGRPPVPIRLDDGEARVPLRDQTNAVDGTSASMLSTGESVLTVRVDDPRCPVTRTLNVATLPARYRAEPTGEPDEWRREVLDTVATGRASTARVLARAELGAGELGPGDLDGALAMIHSRSDCADFEAVGLLHVLHRVRADAWPTGTRERVCAGLLGFKYWIDQPGLDAMCYFTENHQFVWHTAELLAGEMFDRATFTNTGWTGAAHATHGRDMAVEWMRRKLAGGFSEFDSNAYLAIDSLALCSLVEFASDVAVRQLAECVLDKLLFTLASNSWRGVHGAAHGRSYVPTLRSSRFEETAPIMWALWGVGALNNAVLPVTVLATSRCYAVPPVVRAVANALPDEWDGRQVYRGGYRLAHDLLARPYGSDVRVWRTPDGMLSSVQDYRSGLPGLQEHIWGATLSPEVQVFATNPAADSVSSSARPNTWAGQRILPRARQHRATVLALHAGDGNDTHLWFPRPLMNDVAERGVWMAGRVGNGYVAVAAAGGFAAVTTGDEAGQAWLPRGDGRAYVTTLGRTSTHGSFDEFLAALAEPVFGTERDGSPTVSWIDADGHALALSWTGPFTVDDVAVDIDADGRPESPPHLDNPAVIVRFGDPCLRAEWGGERLELDLVAGRRVAPPSGVTP